MGLNPLKFDTLLSFFFLCFILLQAHDHSHDAEINTTTYDQTDENLFIAPLLKCTTDTECSQNNDTGILPICDNVLNRCKCPSTSNGVRVISRNGSSCNFAHQIGDDCSDDFECNGSIPGSLCSKEALKCHCPQGKMPTRQAGTMAGGIESCPATEMEEMPGSEQLKTFKWLFIFILVGYPVLTGLFAILNKGKEDHWFYEKIGSAIDCRKKANQGKVNGKRRRDQNRRNTEEDFLSSDDDESPLEMEIV